MQKLFRFYATKFTVFTISAKSNDLKAQAIANAVVSNFKGRQIIMNV